MPHHPRRADTTIWRAEDLGGAALLRGRFADYTYDLHTHDTACFSLLTRGAIHIRTRHGDFVARKGDLFAIDADEPHAGWPVDGQGWSLRTLYIDLEHVKGLVQDGTASRRRIHLAGPVVRDPELAALFYGVHSCSERDGPALKREEAFLMFVDRLLAHHTREAPDTGKTHRESRAVRRAREFLDHHLDQQVRLGEIAAAADLTPFRLFRAFARETGMSPHAYQRQARVRRAADLIRRGHPLGHVATAAGFSDQAHMTRSFRRTLAVTPGAYRTAMVQEAVGAGPDTAGDRRRCR